MTVTVTYVASYRRALWEESVPSRPAWIVECSEHPALGKCNDGEVWGYVSSGVAQMVATRHQRKHHSPE